MAFLGKNFSFGVAEVSTSRIGDGEDDGDSGEAVADLLFSSDKLIVFIKFPLCLNDKGGLTEGIDKTD